MIPYLHLGPLPIPTFGLMVALALTTSAYILQADFDRRDMKADAFLMITVAGIAGIIGAKLYHLLEPENRELFLAHPLPLLFDRFGFAWFGGFLGGFVAMLLMGWRAKLPRMRFLDACSPAAAFGYGVGRIGCFLSGDGDYGQPTLLPWGMSFPNGTDPTPPRCLQWGLPLDCRVHPTPLYELMISLVIAALLWRIAAKNLNNPRYAGKIFCCYLILTGVARFLVEIIRINPPWILGMSNAQVASVISVLAGVVIFFVVNRKEAEQPARGKAA